MFERVNIEKKREYKENEIRKKEEKSLTLRGYTFTLVRIAYFAPGEEVERVG